MSESKALEAMQVPGPSGIRIVQDLTLSSLGETFARSGFFKDIRQASQAVVKILAGHELGMGPVASMRGIHVFEGHIELAGTTMAGLLKATGRYRIKTLTAVDDRTKAEIEFSEKVDGAWVVLGLSRFSMEDAQRAGLEKKDNWRHYPADMLWNRAMSRGWRRFCSDVGCAPVYAEGEVSELPATEVMQEQGGSELVQRLRYRQGPAVEEATKMAKVAAIGAGTMRVETTAGTAPPDGIHPAFPVTLTPGPDAEGEPELLTPDEPASTDVEEDVFADEEQEEEQDPEAQQREQELEALATLEAGIPWRNSTHRDNTRKKYVHVADLEQATVANLVIYRTEIEKRLAAKASKPTPAPAAAEPKAAPTAQVETPAIAALPLPPDPAAEVPNQAKYLHEVTTSPPAEVRSLIVELERDLGLGPAKRGPLRQQYAGADELPHADFEHLARYYVWLRGQFDRAHLGM